MSYNIDHDILGLMKTEHHSSYMCNNICEYHYYESFGF